MDKKWTILPAGDQEKIVRLIESVGLTRPLANLLCQRGVYDFDAAKSFFRPQLTDELHDPFQMKGMEKAVDRLITAIAQNENILVYGDYDVDGTTSVALIYEYLTRYYEQVGYYIPDRYSEGYGVSRAGVDFAIDNNFSLIIALDCGTKAVEQIAYAKEEGIDFIVCDHHNPGKELPDAILLNPKQTGDQYPFKELSGCGVGFKLVQAFNERHGGTVEDLMSFLDLVAVSIGADLVPIVGENRALAFHGLKQLSDNPRIGFKRLLKENRFAQGDIRISDVVFTIAPRINAAGRIRSGNEAVQLLLATTEKELEGVADQINQHNETRKGLDREITKEALALIEENDWLLNAKSTVVFNEKWHKGVVGIVASRILETHHKPTVVLTESNGEVTGSARSIKGFDMYEAIEACSDLLTRFGGHYFAAGLTLPKENVPAFRLRFNAIAEEQLTEQMLVPELEIDMEIDLRDIFAHYTSGIPKFFRIIKQFAPFGPENPSPVFLTKRVKAFSEPRILKDEHLKVELYQQGDPELRISAIGFGLAEHALTVKDHFVDVVYSLEENVWNGRSSLQMLIKDIRKTKSKDTFY